MFLLFCTIGFFLFVCPTEIRDETVPCATYILWNILFQFYTEWVYTYSYIIYIYIYIYGHIYIFVDTNTRTLIYGLVIRTSTFLNNIRPIKCVTCYAHFSILYYFSIIASFHSFYEHSPDRDSSLFVLDMFYLIIFFSALFVLDVFQYIYTS